MWKRSLHRRKIYMRGFNVREMMGTWTLQMGYPLVTFEQQNDTNIYVIRQERFLKAMNVRLKLLNS